MFWLAEGVGEGSRTLVAELDDDGTGRSAWCIGTPHGTDRGEATRPWPPRGLAIDPDTSPPRFATAVAMLDRALSEGVDAEAARPFLRFLCADAVALVRDKDMRERVADRWWAVDPSAGRGAPLLSGLRAWPCLATLVADLWDRDADAWAASMATDGGARAIAAEAIGRRAPAGLVAGIREASDAYGRLVSASPNRGGRHPRKARPRLAAWLATASSLPGAWMPTGREWDDFLDVAPTIDRAIAWVSVEDLPAFLDVRGRWAEWGDRLRTAAGPATPVEAFVDLIDPAGNLAREILVPAMALSGPPCPEGGERVDAVRAAWSLLHSGRNMATCLAMSRRFHSARGAMRPAVRLAPWMPAAWPAGLPDMSCGDLSLTILTTAGGLVDEGAAGPDRDGVHGLDHCVGDHALRCLEGECRVGSVRRRSASGVHRLSTVEFLVTDGKVTVAQHRGRANADPPPEADALLDAYMARTCGPSAPAPEPSAFRAVPGISTHREGAGYDWHAPGEWDRVAAIWAPSLPRRLRGLTPMAWRKLAERAWPDEGRHQWRRRPWLASA